MNMSRDEFLKEITKEGILQYGTTWLSNFERIKEMKKYKEMWKLFKKNYEFYLVGVKEKQGNLKIGDFINIIEQKYFPKQKTVLTLEIESRDIENSLKEIYSFINSVNDGHITLTGIKDV